MKRNDEPDLLSDLSAETSQSTGDKDPLLGVQIGRYQIASRIAKGGTATVYRAIDQVLNREVAVKILHEHLEQKRDIVDRFKKEAQIIAQLRNPNIVNVYDFLEYQSRAVLVVEYMPGITLSTLIRGVKKIPEDAVLMIALEVLHGLKAAHEKGITHRDIKPANILLHPDLGIKISDFGLAKLTHVDDGLTKDGVFIGTPSFSSPEQIEGNPVDHRSDIFSLGLTLYILATRSHAFKQTGDSTTTVWFKIVKGQFQSIRQRNPDLSHELERILDKALEVQPSKRYQSADEMIASIERLLQKRNLVPYQAELKKFLRSPRTARDVIRGKKSSFSPVLRWMMIVFALSAAGLLYYLSRQSDWVSKIFNQQPTPGPVTEINPSTPQPIIKPEANASPPTSAVQVESHPETKSVGEKSKTVAKKKAATSKKIPTPKGVLVTEGIPLESSSATLVFASISEQPGFLVNWRGGSNFELSRNSRFTDIRVRGESASMAWELKDLETGAYFWKGGNTEGKLNIETLESYRSRFGAMKRPLVVKSQFGDVDLEMNPWQQVLQLSWESGANARSYRLEVASDQGFKHILFAGTVLTKFATIERFWTENQPIFWRVSYLDENKNVFLVDDIRRVNLKIQGAASHFDLLEPRSGQSSTDFVNVKAIGPANSSMRCALVKKDEKFSEWKPIRRQNSFFSDRLPLTQAYDWIVCEAKTGREDPIYFSVPLR